MEGDRPKWRAPRTPRNVRVYTVNDESRYLLVDNFPSVGDGSDLEKLCSLSGTVEECRLLAEEESEAFTDVYLVRMGDIMSARFAKRRVNRESYLGTPLHVTYAPEYETVQETRDKLNHRRAMVTKKTNPNYYKRREARMTHAIPAISSSPYEGGGDPLIQQPRMSWVEAARHAQATAAPPGSTHVLTSSEQRALVDAKHRQEGGELAGAAGSVVVEHASQQRQLPARQQQQQQQQQHALPGNGPGRFEEPVPPEGKYFIDIAPRTGRPMPAASEYVDFYATPTTSAMEKFGGRRHPLPCDAVGVGDDVAARGQRGDVAARGQRGDVAARGQRGDVAARGQRGGVAAALDGDVPCARGDNAVRASGDDVAGRASGGDVAARASGGDVEARASGGDVERALAAMAPSPGTGTGIGGGAGGGVKRAGRGEVKTPKKKRKRI